MTLDEAITNAEEVMVENLEKTKDRNASDPIAINCFKCAEEYRQLAEWLKKLKQLREQTTWIPVSERLPEDGTWNLFTDGKAVSIERYKSDAIDHFYPNGRWFSLEEAVAWMPSPPPYDSQESNDKCKNCEY